MEYVQEFIKQLCESKELEQYNRIRIYLDEDYTSAEHFTVKWFNFIYSYFFFLLNIPVNECDEHEVTHTKNKNPINLCHFRATCRHRNRLTIKNKKEFK